MKKQKTQINKNVKAFLDEEKKVLIEQNISLANHYIWEKVRNREIPRYMIEDFISEIYYKMCLSAFHYDKNKEANFSSFSYYSFKFGEMEVLGRLKKKYKRYQFKPMCCFENKTKEIDFQENEKKSIIEVIETSKISDRNKSILLSYYFSEKNMLQVGRQFGITRQRTEQIISQCLEILRKKIHREELTLQDFK